MAVTQRVRPAGRDDTEKEASGTALPQARRSIVPSVAGVPAWAAVLIALGFSAAGVAIDASRGSDLTSVFAAAYVTGCLLAVAAVRYRGLFTAAVQPPIILFVIVPAAYSFLDPGERGSLRDLALVVGLPLINRFPLMLVGTACALALMGVRVFLARNAARPVARQASRAPLTTDSGPRARRRPRSGREHGDAAPGHTREPVKASARQVPQRSMPGARPGPEPVARRTSSGQRKPRSGAPAHPVPNVRYRDRPPITER